jgi:D-aminopeptidase
MNEAQRPRARDLGIIIGADPPGPHNAITDVPGVRVGHVTLIQGEGKLVIGQGPVRTGATAIVPPGQDWYAQPVEAAHFAFNGAGTTAGLSLIEEYGRIETPVLLTNTLSVGTVYEGVVRYMVERLFAPRGEVPWFSPVVGETSDAYLNDIGGLHVRPEHALEAIDRATDGLVEEGNVGAGTGTGAFGFKAGIGTSSRRVEIEGEQAFIGALVQSNFGGRLTIAGVSMQDLQQEAQKPEPPRGSSIMMVLATNLPLCSRLLHRLCRRATFGLARTGSSGGHGSGDYVIAFSTTYRQREAMAQSRAALARNEGLIDAAFRAAADATEEAILNSLFRAGPMMGRDDHRRQALPVERVVERLRRAGAIA